MTFGQDLLDGLPPATRLALVYARRGVREAMTLALLLDARLARIVRSGGEELLRQVRLAWWRDRLSEPSAQWPGGEPLLAALADWPHDFQPLVALVDGWEALISAEPLDVERASLFASGRAAALSAAIGAGAQPVAGQWALADLAAHLESPAERAVVMTMIEPAGPDLRSLPRDGRGLAVLAALAFRQLRAADRGGEVSVLGLLAAVRVGLIGR